MWKRFLMWAFQWPKPYHLMGYQDKDKFKLNVAESLGLKKCPPRLIRLITKPKRITGSPLGTHCAAAARAAVASLLDSLLRQLWKPDFAAQLSGGRPRIEDWADEPLEL